MLDDSRIARRGCADLYLCDASCSPVGLWRARKKLEWTTLILAASSFLASLIFIPSIHQLQYVFQSNLNGVSGFGFMSGLTGTAFGPCPYYVEGGLSRVSYGCPGSTVTPFASGLSAPIDLVFSPSSTSPFGNFLYVTESGANRISRVDPTGTVTTFATFSTAPKRMEFARRWDRLRPTRYS